MKKTIAVIGCGSAALMFAASIDENQYDVKLYERKSAPARKFLVAGDGGFNLTHAEDLELLISRYTPSNYLENCLRAFSNTNLQNWLAKIGIPTFVGSSNRVFPVKGIKPIDVLNAFLTIIKQKGFSIQTAHDWTGWNESDELIFEHEGKSVSVKPDITVFALGGGSWSVTGSDGKWTEFFTNKGIDIIPFQSSNCAFEIEWSQEFISEAEGQALKNIVVSSQGKTKAGEVVITRFGMEGGAIYALSPEIREQLSEHNSARIFIDLKPTLDLETIKAKLNKKGNHTVSTVLLQQLKVNKLQIALLKSILSKEQFTDTDALAEHIKQLPIHIVGLAPIDEAISTVGGIALHETGANFELHKLPHHYAIGEMLDWDAPTGGYLLQGCFSMGRYLAEAISH